MKDICKECSFYRAEEEDFVVGVCRRYPPKLVDADEDGYSSEYPPVSEDDWCGEFNNQVGRRDLEE
jgi:hypothetical protein